LLDCCRFPVTFLYGKIYAWPHPVLKTGDFLVSEGGIEGFFCVFIHVGRVKNGMWCWQAGVDGGVFWGGSHALGT
jgi:hypothetical protein